MFYRKCRSDLKGGVLQRSKQLHPIHSILVNDESAFDPGARCSQVVLYYNAKIVCTSLQDKDHLKYFIRSSAGHSVELDMDALACRLRDSKHSSFPKPILVGYGYRVDYLHVAL